MQRDSFKNVQKPAPRAHNSRQGGPAQGAPESAAHTPARHILGLQQTIGNQAVRRLLLSSSIQAKLTVSQPDDRYEQEADRTAEAVMRAPINVVTGSHPPLINRAASDTTQDAKEEEEKLARRPARGPLLEHEKPDEECEESGSTVLQREKSGEDDEELMRAGARGAEESSVPHGFAALMEESSGEGRPVPEETRTHFESRLGADFSSVRIHTGESATRLNRSIQAKAFTRGNEIYFSEGAYDPSSSGGQSLLAHELTHVLQQTGSDKSLAGDGGEKSGLSTVSRSADEVIQKKNGKDDKVVRIPIQVHVDRPITKEEFIQQAIAQLNLDPKMVGWRNLKDQYNPADSPVTLLVDAALIKKSRANKTGSDVGLDVDKSGNIAGAGERADEFSNMPRDAEKQYLLDEIDRRFWKATGIKGGVKIKDAKQAGQIAMWNQIRDEVLAQRAFIENLPEKVQYIIKFAADGVTLLPENYEQIVRIAKKIEQLNLADLENYLKKAEETSSFNTLENGIDSFLKTKQAAPAKIKELMGKIDEDDSDSDSMAAELDDDTMFYLSLDQRIKAIKNIADGSRVGDEDEQTIIRLLTTTPLGDLKALLGELKKSESALLKQLESVIDGSENTEYYAALRNIVFQSFEPDELEKKMGSAKIFPWADPGGIKAAYKRRFHYEVEYTKEGKIKVKYWISAGPASLGTQEQFLEPDEIIGVRFLMDEDFAGAKEGETIFMPAANLLSFHHKQFKQEISFAVDVVLLMAGGAGLFAKGARLAKAIAILDTALAVGSLTINSFRSEIAQTEEGKNFLKVWDTVNTLIAVYGLARVVVHLPQTFMNLKTAYQNFRSKIKGIDLGKLSTIDNDANKIFSQADQAAFEGEVADLRKKFTVDEMTAFEKQIEKAGGLSDAGKRQAAIADIKSQISTQKENAALVAELKKANPGKSNKEIAELAKAKIKVPNVPHGMTADEFHEAQDLIKKFLNDKGLKDVEGFATGSRVTGVTFNPKKPGFGQISTDLSKKDFDITLITPRELKSGEIRDLEKLYKAKFKHELGVRNIFDKRQLAYIPQYGKIDLNLK